MMANGFIYDIRVNGDYTTTVSSLKEAYYYCYHYCMTHSKCTLTVILTEVIDGRGGPVDMICTPHSTVHKVKVMGVPRVFITKIIKDDGKWKYAEISPKGTLINKSNRRSA